MVRRFRAALLGVTTAVALTACSQSAPTPADPTGASTTAATVRVPVPTPTRTAAAATAAVPSHGGRSAAPRAVHVTVAPLSRQQRADGLVDVRSVVADAVVNLRYATSRNFTHVRLYPVHARCLVHRSMIRGLRTAAAVLRGRGYRLVFWDCYRPHAVQVRMYRVVPNPTWVARPGAYATSHESARSVDVTIASAPCLRRPGHTLGGCLADMGTGFDAFTPRAYAYATYGLTARQVRSRAVLRSAMYRGGLSVYAGEWWHFDVAGSRTPRAILSAGLL